MGLSVICEATTQTPHLFLGHGYDRRMTDRGPASAKAEVTIDADPARAFAFDVNYFGVPIAHWRYDIAAVDGGCRVTEGTWDHRPGWMAVAGGLATGISDRDTANDSHIKLTLQRLKERAEILS